MDNKNNRQLAKGEEERRGEIKLKRKITTKAWLCYHTLKSTEDTNPERGGGKKAKKTENIY